MNTPVSHHLLLHPFSVAALCPPFCLPSGFGSLRSTSQIVSFPWLHLEHPWSHQASKWGCFLKAAIWVPNRKASIQHSPPQRLWHLVVPLKERMTSLWPRCGKWFQGLQSSHRSVAQSHRGDELSNFVRSISSCRSTPHSIGRFRRGGVERLRPGHPHWFHSISLLLNIRVAPLPKGRSIPLKSRRKQAASVDTRIRCSVWPGEITETLHTPNVEQQLVLLQMYDCSTADWKNAQFLNKVSQKRSASGQFYPAAACSTDSI